jgi:di- and tripeptidase
MFLCSDLPRDDSSSEDGDESSSDITLHDEHPLASDSGRRDSLTGWLDDSDKAVSPVLFPFQLLSGCSTAERVMCQFSRAITSQEMRTRTGSQGTLTWRSRCGVVERDEPANPTKRRRGRGQWTLGASAVIAPRLIQAAFTTRHAGTAPSTLDEAGLTLPMTAPPQHDGAAESNGVERPPSRTPVLAHRMKHDKSILALAVSSQYIFAGTQGGEILVRRARGITFILG